MALFDSIEETSKKAADLAEGYLKTSRAYIRLKVFQQLTISISLIAKTVLIGGLLLAGAIFIAIALVILIGEWLGNMAWGCVVVAILFLLAGFIAYTQRAKIDSIVIKKMSPKFFDHANDE
ncbi:hypothetical protein [Aegicerativicinus sediminis]|uniref:hypothetical protein n=1 Tax=Aegicerativicinus sediminis TaxID=2893202 RepID=UPI001E4F479C|nr:hypothetical protein [Aegicerativicinus sediminis]